VVCVLSGAGPAVDWHDRAGDHRSAVAEQPGGGLGDLAGSAIRPSGIVPKPDGWMLLVTAIERRS
jgi:hypothetical protein